MGSTEENSAAAPLPTEDRSTAWRWYIVFLLFSATVINYLDRQTLAVVSKRIIAPEEFNLNKEQYGNLELAFGLAFAVGGPLVGLLVDRVNLYWVYPTVLLSWSAMGVITGFASTYGELIACRILLGLFEAGHWPCALRTVQRILPPSDRAFANGWLQGGTAIGAILTPLAVWALLSPEPGGWRPAFQTIGFVGMFWVLFWLPSIRPCDLDRPPSETALPDADIRESPLDAVLNVRFATMAVLIMCINTNLHLFRVWLPLFVQEGRGYTETDMYLINVGFYVAADFGSLTAGGVAMLLCRRLGISVFSARVSTYAVFASMCVSTTAVALLPAGPAFLAALMATAVGMLGVYPFYYSFAQDISIRHVGFVTGLLSFFAWVVPAGTHKLVGAHVDATGSYDLAIGLVGWLPLLPLPLLILFWPREPITAEANPTPPATAEAKPRS